MEQIYQNSPYVNSALAEMVELAQSSRHEYVTPEHFLSALLTFVDVRDSISHCGGDPEKLDMELDHYLDGLDSVPEGCDYTDPEESDQLQTMFRMAVTTVAMSNSKTVTVPHVLKAMLSLPESTARYLLASSISGRTGELFAQIISRDYVTEDLHPEELMESLTGKYYDYPDTDTEDNGYGHSPDAGEWKSLVTCVNDNIGNRNPLIGREAELERTVQVLCRKDKNNPLHIGEPGVGKTALVYGLARRIEDGDVPQRLIGAKIYQVELGNLVAGTQYRGDFERRIKIIMDGISKVANPIVYIDEIHSLVGAGAVGESSLDASNMLKPYLEQGKIRFIGSTTYEEYKKYFARSKGIVRRFQQIDIDEPSVEQTIEILMRLKEIYEEFHGVSYDDRAIDFAARASAKHITGRFLPDKAIDLIDEAGAYRVTHPLADGKQTVDATLVSKVLAKMCKVDSLSAEESEGVQLENLEKRMSAKIFGQEKAVRDVTEAVLIAKAGIEDDTKPLASLLFVGPTGVGKTEVAKVLADELAIPLVRFDMSEYTEKHAVAKLIGAPAGYVGYEDGGLLTDAVRKTPSCVLLLDEIEKAHEDIYNILLQVMDYASLTDNRGNKADFRNVIIIMTSNAGAQFAHQANLGFASSVTPGDAMMRQVKKTFKPEFINRLSGTVIFNAMNRDMASRILDRKLQTLAGRLAARKVAFNLTEEARDFLLRTAFSSEYGAREIDRVISSTLKPLLMREILFGSLKEGGEAVITISGDKPVILS